MSIVEKMAQFVERMHASGVAARRDLRGCSLAEIDALEKKYGITLPRSYRLFLTYMGHCAGTLARGDSKLLYSAVLNRTHQESHKEYEPYMPANCGWLYRLHCRVDAFFRRFAQRDEHDAHALPTDGLIIYSDLSLPFFWMIRCNQGDDSPVYTFDYEGDKIELRQDYDSLFDFLEVLRKEAVETATAS